MQQQQRNLAAACLIVAVGLLLLLATIEPHDQAETVPTPPRPPAFDPPTYIVLPHEPTADEQRPPNNSAWSFYSPRRSRGRPR